MHRRCGSRKLELGVKPPVPFQILGEVVHNRIQERLLRRGGRSARCETLELLLLDNRLEDPLGRGDALSDLGEFRDAVLPQGSHPVWEELQLGARDEDVHGKVDAEVNPFFLAADGWADKYVSAHAGNGSEAEWLELDPSPVVAGWELVGDEVVQLWLQVQGSARNFGGCYMSTEYVDYRLPLVAFDGEAGVLGLECLQTHACLVSFSLSIQQPFLSHLVLLRLGVQKMVGQQLCLTDIP